MAVQGFGDRLERRLDQRQDLVAVARDRVLDALHVGAGALALRFDAGPALIICVCERGQQLGVTGSPLTNSKRGYSAQYLSLS